MANSTRTEARTCRRCGADALASPGAYATRVEAEGEGRGPLHLCAACGREFASDRERDEYVRLGVLA